MQLHTYIHTSSFAKRFGHFVGLVPCRFLAYTFYSGCPCTASRQIPVNLLFQLAESERYSSSMGGCPGLPHTDLILSRLRNQAWCIRAVAGAYTAYPSVSTFYFKFFRLFSTQQGRYNIITPPLKKNLRNLAISVREWNWIFFFSPSTLFDCSSFILRSIFLSFLQKFSLLCALKDWRFAWRGFRG